MNIDWIQIFEDEFPVACSERVFRANFGVSPYVCQLVWEVLITSENYIFEPLNLLWALSFLKNYTINDVLHAQFGTSERNCRDWVWRVIKELFELLDEVFFLILHLRIFLILIERRLIQMTDFFRILLFHKLIWLLMSQFVLYKGQRIM